MIGASVASDKPEKDSLWKLLIFPALTLWKRDKTFLLLFVVVNIIVGQVGLLTSLLLSWQSGSELLRAWEQNLTSGTLFTFSISLVVSSIALIGSEIIDAFRAKIQIRLLEHKAVWSLFAAAILVLQTPLVGALLSTPATPPQAAVATFTSDITKQKSSTKETAQASMDANSTQTVESPPPNNRQSAQVVFWILSMVVSLQLFSLSRHHLIPDSYAHDRNEEVKTMSANADSKTTTSFGETV